MFTIRLHNVSCTILPIYLSIVSEMMKWILRRYNHYIKSDNMEFFFTLLTISYLFQSFKHHEIHQYKIPNNNRKNDHRNSNSHRVTWKFYTFILVESFYFVYTIMCMLFCEKLKVHYHHVMFNSFWSLIFYSRINHREQCGQFTVSGKRKY